METTSDGLVGVGVGTGQQWLDFCVMVEHPEWMEDRSLFANRAHLRPDIAAWMAEHTTAEVLELAGAFRIPHAPIGNGATIPATDHFVARGSIVRNPRDGFVEPGRPYRFDPPLLRDPEPAPRLGEHDGTTRDRRSPRAAAGERRRDRGDRCRSQGLRVLDLTAFWAGPLCTHVLAMLGAEVLHVESTARPDGTRLLAGLRFSEPDWWERSGIFSGLNTNKKSVTLDLATDRGRELLRRLIATCDVIVENYTPRVLEQIGLDVDAVRAIRPDVVMVRMPGFGLDGPWRDNPAFAFVIEDAAGLTWMTGYPDQNPVSPYCVGDSNAGHARARAACSSRWSTAGAPARACSSRRRWWTPRSTSRPSRSSSTRPTARCSSGTATGDRPPRRRTSTCTADADDARASATPGSRSPSPPTSSGWPCATRSVARRGRWTRR